jgi:FkbM family methyltransferase
MEINTDASMSFAYKNEAFGHHYLKGYRKKFLSLAQGLSTSYWSQRLGFVLRKLVLLNTLKVIDGEAFGIKARFYPLDNLADRLFLFLPKIFETDEFIFLKKHLTPESVFIDIGANSGFYSLVAAQVINSQGKIIAFEPNPVMIARLRMNISLNGKDGIIEVMPFGLADRITEFDLALDPTNLGGSTIMKTKREHIVKIKCMPLLDALKGKVDRIDFLKIDIEGADILVMNAFFKSAPASLYPKFIIIETDEGLDLESLGYKAIAKTKAHNTIYKLN